MPIPFAIVFRILVMLVLALHVFYMYCTARTWSETFGFHLGTSLLAALFGLVMLIPLVWAVTLPELPEIYTTHWRPRWRWRRGRCPVCGYRIQGLPDRTCPECGGALEAPTGYRINAHTIKLFIALNIAAWLIGVVGGELWIENDERQFRHAVDQYVQSGGRTGMVSNRAWPNQHCSMVFNYGQGIHATD